MTATIIHSDKDKIIFREAQAKRQRCPDCGWDITDEPTTWSYRKRRYSKECPICGRRVITGDLSAVLG